MTSITHVARAETDFSTTVLETRRIVNHVDHELRNHGQVIGLATWTPHRVKEPFSVYDVKSTYRGDVASLTAACALLG